MATGKSLKNHQSRQDHFAKKARAAGYVSRAAFKLEEIDQKFNIFRRGQRVLDLGCRPGAWLQYAASKITPDGYLVGVDRRTDDVKKPRAIAAERTTIIEADIYDLLDGIQDRTQLQCTAPYVPTQKESDKQDAASTYSHIFSQKFDVVLSDMAPDLSGIKLRDHANMEALLDLVLDVAQRFGTEQCVVVAKTFMMPDLKAIETRYRAHFPKTKIILSKATRDKSSERYLIAKHR